MCVLKGMPGVKPRFVWQSLRRLKPAANPKGRAGYRRLRVDVLRVGGKQILPQAEPGRGIRQAGMVIPAYGRREFSAAFEARCCPLRSHEVQLLRYTCERDPEAGPS